MLLPRTMRALVVLALLALLPFALAPGAGAGYGGGTYCPSYELEADAGTAGAQVSTADPWGAVVLKAGDFYLVEDTFYVNSIGEPYLFSLWLYEESGHEAGLQRSDEVCSQCPWDWTLCDFNLFY